MTKGKSILIKLVSSANTGYFYATQKCVLVAARCLALSHCQGTPHLLPPLPPFLCARNPTNIAHKLAFMKYDPIVRQHVLFTESKMPKGRGGRRAGKK